MRMDGSSCRTGRTSATPYSTHQVYQRPLLGRESYIRQLCVLRLQRIPHGVKSAKPLLNHPSPVVDDAPRKKTCDHRTEVREQAEAQLKDSLWPTGLAVCARMVSVAKAEIAV